MKLSKLYMYSLWIVVALVGFFLLPKISFAQLSMDPLFITDVPQLEAYPYSFQNGTQVGFCILADFETSQNTNIILRTTPFSQISNPVWSYNTTPIPVLTSGGGLNMIFGNFLEPGIEYILQFVELASDGSYHIITPSAQTDEIAVMCTPELDGTLSSNCPSGNFVLTECSPTAVSQAQGGNNSGLSPTIFNVQSGENSLSFSINTEGMTPGQTIQLVYTTDPLTITSGTFQGVQSLSFMIPSQGPISVTLTSLQTNTTYYVTILDQNQMVLINTTTGLPYETMATGANTSNTNTSGTTGAGEAATININLSGTFGQEELEGEDINQGFTQCGYGETYDCDFNQLLATIDRIIKFMLYIVMLPLAAIGLAWSGIKLIIAQSQGKKSAYSDAKAMFTKILVGTAFALGAWVMVKFVLVILGYTDASGVLTQILGITTTQ